MLQKPKSRDELDSLIDEVDNLLFEEFQDTGMPSQTHPVYKKLRATILAYITKEKIKWQRENL